MKEFYYKEWKIAEKLGCVDYADACKEKYRELTLKEIIKPFNQFDERLKKFPLINLN